MKKQENAYPLRLPADLYKYIKETSIEQVRTINEQIIFIIKDFKKRNEDIE